MVEQDIALTDWLKPFVEKLGHKKRRQMCRCIFRVSSDLVIARVSSRWRNALRPITMTALHHFISDGIWEASPLEEELAAQADRLVGASDAFLVIDDTGPSRRRRCRHSRSRARFPPP